MRKSWNYHDRQKLIKDYKVVFEALPQLKRLALDYWEQTKSLSLSGSRAVQEEESIFSSTVLEMAEILLSDESFEAVMSRIGVNPEENAIIESVLMIEVVLDIEEESNNKMQ